LTSSVNSVNDISNNQSNNNVENNNGDNDGKELSKSKASFRIEIVEDGTTKKEKRRSRINADGRQLSNKGEKILVQKSSKPTIITSSCPPSFAVNNSTNTPNTTNVEEEREHVQKHRSRSKSPSKSPSRSGSPSGSQSSDGINDNSILNRSQSAEVAKVPHRIKQHRKVRSTGGTTHDIVQTT
jgi:hypothetical protein